MRQLRDWLDDRLWELHRIRVDEGPEAFAIVLTLLGSLALVAGMLSAGALSLVVR